MFFTMPPFCAEYSCYHQECEGTQAPCNNSNKLPVQKTVLLSPARSIGHRTTALTSVWNKAYSFCYIFQYAETACMSMIRDLCCILLSDAGDMIMAVELEHACQSVSCATFTAVTACIAYPAHAGGRCCCTSSASCTLSASVSGYSSI